MDVIISELLPVVIGTPSLEDLKAAANRQILILSEQKNKLDGIHTDLEQLIQKYNAQKSYFGHAAHWYGEQEWWLKLTVTLLIAGIGSLLYIPVIISIALSLTLSFLLIEHDTVAKERDRLITEDLTAQNRSVEVMLGLLNGTRENLEKGLTSLCEMNLRMGEENTRLRTQVDTVTHQVATVTELNENLQAIIQSLQANELEMTRQLRDMEKALKKYEQMLSEGTRSFATSNQLFQTTTDAMRVNSEVLDHFTKQVGKQVSLFPSTPNSGYSSTRSSPDDQNVTASSLAIRKAQRLLQDGTDPSEQEIANLTDKVQAMSPLRGHPFPSPSGKK